MPGVRRYSYPPKGHKPSATPRPPAYSVREACDWLGVPQNMSRWVGFKAKQELTQIGPGVGARPRYAKDDIKALIVRMGLFKE
jgi:hypothetical protein